MVSKVPHVQGNCKEVMTTLIELIPRSLVYGDEKFCTILYLCGFRMIDRGEVWNGPMQSSTCCHGNGPSYLVVLDSRLMICMVCCN